MADFPDLNDDGKVTRADVLKGRGVFKKGGKVKKMRKFQEGGETEFESKYLNPRRLKVFSKTKKTFKD